MSSGNRLRHLAGKDTTLTQIPCRIFQTWKTKHHLPPLFSQWSRTFRDMNPEFVYDLWDDQDNLHFIQEEFPWFLASYQGYPAEIYRADAVRYFYLYKFGGIYADLDTECLRPLGGLLTLADVLLGRMGSDATFAHSIPNAIMASKPRQEFWLLVIYLLMRRATHIGRPEVLTGPVLLKTAVDLYLTRHSRFIEQWVFRFTMSEKEEARLHLAFSGEQVDGFYYGVLGHHLPVTGTHIHGSIMLQLTGSSAYTDKPLSMRVAGTLLGYTFSGTYTYQYSDRVLSGVWSAIRSASLSPVETAIVEISSKLMPDQQPEVSASTLSILDRRFWYPIDWSHGEGQKLRDNILTGHLLDADKKRTLFPDAWMVTYWAHSWE